mmetsp:Transcript_23022/g.16348  ORF Transcript_23022/g.16348 Transcript_23022/m.16348 type:complete len:102 (+) Transcript_23022:2034-2339(+)|eukprot:CAMPEP_0116888436 /NCGR_PEP_ID=MMETSP0463-20121206/23445_1 /TAXON_ID=181622 /ORGANISM="Strombidinopsis sp, Strain SopsisLIS2011" /LENGTH=101 /DNA_ID=CAMNT_0004553173 /DNA_START=468 /DNA_END=773 /DNA_ORIENTATION=-
MENPQNLFSPEKRAFNEEDGQNDDEISLSVFSVAKKQARRRPMTAHPTSEAIMKRMPGYKPPVVPLEEGQEAPAEPKPSAFPDFGTTMEMVTKSAADAARQ